MKQSLKRRLKGNSFYAPRFASMTCLKAERSKEFLDVSSLLSLFSYRRFPHLSSKHCQCQATTLLGNKVLKQLPALMIIQLRHPKELVFAREPNQPGGQNCQVTSTILSFLKYVPWYTGNTPRNNTKKRKTWTFKTSISLHYLLLFALILVLYL